MPPASRAAIGAYPGAPNVWTTNKYVLRAKGKVRVRGVMVNIPKEAVQLLLATVVLLNSGERKGLDLADAYDRTPSFCI